MYSHCLFCARDLGRNEALEAFPVGQRLAYDQAKGRLWVVCPLCARWNLTPLEERWEAIEQAERLFRGAVKRASTENVGLARVADGTELVRVGAPLRPEFAAWRYGRHLRARRVAFNVRVVPLIAVGTAGAAAFVAVPYVAMSYASAHGAGWLGAVAVGIVADKVVHRAVHRAVHLLGRVESADKGAGAVAARVAGSGTGVLTVRHGHLAESTLSASSSGELRLDLRHDGGRVELTDAAARHAAAQIAPALNDAGGSADDVTHAVALIERRGGSDGCLAAMGRWSDKRTQPAEHAPARWTSRHRIPEAGLLALTGTQSLAFEIAVHEAHEQSGLKGTPAPGTLSGSRPPP